MEPAAENLRALMPPPLISQFRKCSASSCGRSSACGARLKACGRCKTSRYCSTTCQTVDWPSHKTTCNLNSAVDQVYAAPGDRSLSAHLRRWESLHTPTFVLACVLGMDLCQEPRNVFDCALVVNVIPRESVDPRAKFAVSLVERKTFSEVSEFLQRTGHGQVIERHQAESRVANEMGALGQALVLLRCQSSGFPTLLELKPVLITSEAVNAYRASPLPIQSGSDWTQSFQRAIDEDWARLYHMNVTAANYFMPTSDALDVRG